MNVGYRMELSEAERVRCIGPGDEPIAPIPGHPQRYDSGYRCNGTASLFVMVDVDRPRRHVKVTDRRTGQDFAECMRGLVNRHYPSVEKIRVVLDNPSTQSAASLYNSFAAPEGLCVLRKKSFSICRSTQVSSTW